MAREDVQNNLHLLDAYYAEIVNHVTPSHITPYLIMCVKDRMLINCIFTIARLCNILNY